MTIIGKGKKWREISGQASSLSRHFDVNTVKAWRTAEDNAGRPSGLQDFYKSHGLCRDCRCVGFQITGYDEEAKEQLYSPCATCTGTGEKR